MNEWIPQNGEQHTTIATPPIASIGWADRPSDPALRAALYAVIANVPGIQLLGSAIDHSGRRGTEIRLGGGNAARSEVSLDPNTGSVLEINRVVADPRRRQPTPPQP
jgi:hypothetical protein